MVNQKLTLRKTLEEYAQARDEALIMVQRQFDGQQRLVEHLADFGSSLSPHSIMIRSSFDAIRKELDRAFWRRAFELTNFRQLMDAEAKREFDRDLENQSPEFTLDGVTETFLSLAQDADMMFRRGIVNVFTSLCGDYQTNKKEPFRIGEKVIISHAIGDGWSNSLRIGYNREQTINDIDRVFKVLAGLKFKSRQLESDMNKAFMKGETYECEFYKAKAFKNGNLHLWIKKEDLLELANGLIAQHYGENKLAA